MSKQLILGKEPLEVKFQMFHKENPGVYKMFKRFAFSMIKRGHKRLGSKKIIEDIRWESRLKTTGSPYKIPNHFTAYYARLFERDHPEYTEIFITKPLKAY